MPALESISTSLDIKGHAALEQIELPALRTAASISVVYQDALKELSFPALTDVEEDYFAVKWNPVLESISAPALVLGQPAQIAENPNLLTCEGDALSEVLDCQ